jgi:hypothetical protein
MAERGSDVTRSGWARLRAGMLCTILTVAAQLAGPGLAVGAVLLITKARRPLA